MEETRSFVFFYDYIEQFDMLTNEQIGELMRAIMSHVNGRAVDFDSGDIAVKLMYTMMTKAIDRGIERMNKTSSRRSAAAKDRERKRREDEESGTLSDESTTAPQESTTEHAVAQESTTEHAVAQESTTEHAVAQESTTEHAVARRGETETETKTKTETESLSETKTKTETKTESLSLSETKTAVSGFMDEPYPFVNTTTDETTTTERNGTFNEPTVEEVRRYCGEINSRVDAKRFVDYYSANGWMVGRNRMKDWRAAVRVWDEKEKKVQPAPKREQTAPSYDMSEIERRSFQKYIDLSAKY